MVIRSRMNQSVWLVKRICRVTCFVHERISFSEWINDSLKRSLLSLPTGLSIKPAKRATEILTTNTQNGTITDRRGDRDIMLKYPSKKKNNLLFSLITTLLFCFPPSVTEKETHWEWYCCPGISGGPHSLHFGCDQIPLLALFYCSAENKERKWGRRRWRIISGKTKNFVATFCFINKLF